MAEARARGGGFAALLENTRWMQKTDILMGIGIIAVVTMLIIPLPTFLLDFFLVISIMSGLLILMIVMFIGRTFDFSIFPSLLLITTVYRLALNVSSTRLILLQGAAFDGKIIRAFGEFVVGGNYVVGFIIFIILVAVQFIVITKGATRTAEVAARFTLDAMPGKQMSIDSDLSNGLITEDEARKRREEIRKEADFYGAMDGASKFVQGDVKVAIVITFINIIGGFIIGMVMRNEPFDVALKTYTLLTIGEGLVAQIPSLLITTATGIIVTRAVSNENMGQDLADQLGSQPRALLITAATLGVAIVIPGFPKLALLILSVGLGALGYVLLQSQTEEKEKVERKEKEAALKEHRPEEVTQLVQVDPLEVEIGYNLIPLVDPEQGGTLLERITNIRRRSALDMGLIVPPIRIRDNMELEPEVYSILIKGVEVGRGSLQVDKLMAMDSGEVAEKIEGQEFTEPVFGLKAIWIKTDVRDVAESRGYTVVDCPTIIATHLTEIIKRHADEILGRQEVQKLIDTVKEDYPAVVRELVEDHKMSLGEIQKVLQALLRERVSIRNIVTILETLSSYVSYSKDPSFLTEYVRIALSRQITKDYVDKTNTLSVITVDPEIETIIRNSIHEDPIEGPVLAMDPTTHQTVVSALLDAYRRSKSMGHAPVYLVSPQIRRVTFTLLEREMPAPVVLSYSEISSAVKVEVVVSALLSSAA
ncbi:MAG TPA: flagellar biosynthesis protein FlhA [Spirochaetota bacterium]|nr:flagellar biosynthesis protein FlhA [Spirochaetota bacterium]HPC40614.1 flagellar biosynthesis protein FlhA [Spirochaetota bacterium]HPL18334.1 flagellar biosynthesis protein FlhA [Spirochaetota bacterium]HQF07878.1 flagellar biosynthesis protein FlhA [Spirochaetota bacterium]HQH96437.1 flagellar biosynthesis protein FlhA [Spirochaetota bacterium]